MRVILKSVFVGVLCVFLQGCYPFISKMNIVQGNYIEDESIKKLQIGMNKEQVRFLLGNALLKDTFHPNRWDYLFTIRQSGAKEYIEYMHLSVYFEQDAVSKFELQETPPQQ